MHPFGGSAICPRCSKAVYAAEQILGPGRKLYHKPCMTCTSCNKRLDSYSLVEHNQEPYCKACHVKNFGTRDLRSANLPHRGDTLSLALHTTGGGFDSSPRFTTVSSPQPISTHTSANGGRTRPSPVLRPNRALSPGPTPTASTFTIDPPPRSRTAPPPEGSSETNAEDDEERDTVEPLYFDHEVSLQDSYTGAPTNTGRTGLGNLPRTVPLSPSYTGSAPISPTKGTLGRSNSSANATSTPRVVPLVQTATGTRYGVGLTAQPTGGSARQWGGVNPKCPKCGRSVFFAEQVKAVGKTWHKACLRCTSCGTTLDSSKLTDKDGDPFCRSCYGKLHGPAGQGYALVGKAGG